MGQSHDNILLPFQCTALCTWPGDVCCHGKAHQVAWATITASGHCCFWRSLLLTPDFWVVMMILYFPRYKNHLWPFLTLTPSLTSCTLVIMWHLTLIWLGSVSGHNCSRLIMYIDVEKKEAARIDAYE